MKKLITFISLVLLLVFTTLGAEAANQIGKRDFENNLTDSYGNSTFEDSTCVRSYLSGYDGQAARVTHSVSDCSGGDGGPDPRIYMYMTSTREIYMSFYVKYESAYAYSCGGGNNNIKYQWLDSANAHWELILQSGRGGWELSATKDSGWGTSGGTGVTEYASTVVIDNQWHFVETYWKESTGGSNTNSDGEMFLKVDGSTVYSYVGIKTGTLYGAKINLPSIKATCSPSSGQGWWQMDKWEAWDGIPEGGDITAPQVTSGVIQADGTSLFITVTEPVIMNNLAGFHLAGTAGGIDVSSCVEQSSTVIDCTLDGEILQGASGITGSYGMISPFPPDNAIEDGAGNDLGNFADRPITNSSGITAPDTAPPTVDSVTIPELGTTMVVVLNESATDSGDGSQWALTMSGAAVTVSSPSVNGDVITYTLSRAIQHDETLTSLVYTQPGNGIEDIANNDLATLDPYSGTFNQYSQAGIPIWGDITPNANVIGSSTVRMMGGNSPDIENMAVTEVYCYMGGGTATARLGVFQGGTLADPDGATLVWDAGEVTVDAAAAYYGKTGGSAALAANTPTWIRWKGTGFDVYYSTSPADGGDFQDGEGRFNDNTEGVDATQNWESPVSGIADGGSFGNFWYSCYLIYEDSPDISPPALESITISNLGTKIIMEFDEDVTEAGDGSDWAVTIDNNLVVLSNPSVDAGQITYDLSYRVNKGRALTSVYYTQPGGDAGIEDSLGADLATISDDFAGNFNNASDIIYHSDSGTILGMLAEEKR